MKNFLRLLMLANFVTPPPQDMLVGVRYGNQVLVTTNQLLNPAGTRIEIPERPVDMAISPRGDVLAVLASGLHLFSASGQPLRTIPLPAQRSMAGLAFSPDGLQVAVSTLGATPAVTIVDANGSGVPVRVPLPAGSLPMGLVFDPSGTTLYVALSRLNSVARIDLGRRVVTGTVDVGVAPFGLAMTPAGNRLFVTNWGGRRPVAGEATAPSSGTLTLVDPRGIAASGTVSVVDLGTLKVSAEVPVGLHPSAIQADSQGRFIAVANSNSDSVTLLDAGTFQPVSIVNLPAFPQGYPGSSPTSLAFSAGGQRLYVTCGGNNALAVLENQAGQFQLRGYVPTDWYPIAVAISTAADSTETVYVANSKGIGARNPGNFNVLQVRGTVNILQAVDLAASWSAEVTAANDPFRGVPQFNHRGGRHERGMQRNSSTNLSQLGIDHVFLIIKENRTYDQVLGDLPVGNGDSSKTMYGRAVTPNQHQLATQFVLLDNYYASGTVSADGHQWLTQAMASDYIERSQFIWPRSYPFSGEDPLAFVSSGFIWDDARGRGLTARIYGEFTLAASAYTATWANYLKDAQAPAMQLPVRSHSPIASLNPLIEPAYPAFALNVPDAYRARIFLDRFQAFEQQGALPNLIMIWLPSDHTNGTAPGSASPDAMVADNDLAVGRIVEAISASRDWPRSAIFITEDDAQDGLDHVDGHRTICLVVSPYVRRGVVDSTHYNQTSVLRTIEELLGLPQMNKFDAAALPMRSVFTTSPDRRGYVSVPNAVPLDKMNPPAAALSGAARQAALDSQAMDFSRPDAAPEEKLNRILWHAARGWSARYPERTSVPGRAESDDRE